MKEKIVALCDTETEYVRKFCDYVCEKKEYPFDMAAFTSLEKLLEFDKLSDIVMLLISEAEYDPLLEKKINGQVIILKAEKKEEECEQNESIYKFQPCDQILREAIYYCNPEMMPAVQNRNRLGKLKIIGLFSPIRGLGQTTLALTLGQMIAKNKKCLYLNFEAFSGFGEKFQQEYSADMTDLLYYLSNAKGSLFYKVQSMIQSCGTLDYIPPAFSYLDLHQIHTEEWMDFFEELEKNSSYEYLILDLSENVQGLFEILNLCAKVISLVGKTKGSKEKWNQYQMLLTHAGMDKIIEKTILWNKEIPDNLPKEPWNLMESKAVNWIAGMMEMIG